LKSCDKPYPRATGIFVDSFQGDTWQVRKLPGECRRRPTYYLHWADEDPGGSFTDEDGTYTPMTPKEIEALWSVKRIQES
jgi:hypothetical protein